ncbi:MAG: hypothetical protein AW09_002960 [Candidatus Accumulibacter phosphatis]|uniref:Uncharacterized protein n=1 Tax=Candidatus Accumulibacter phosphatis TaxID=327160 RepID=A0A080LVZ0_9PROT|nr:MAG: hypothetical protein AW09_002960 [Candidatus Accumulibacter phosphatis]
MRGDRIEELGRTGQAQVVDFEKQATRQAQSLIDPEAVVETRIVDQALPSDRRARFFKVHAHDDQQIVDETGNFLLQSLSVFNGRIDVVNRAGSKHHQQAVVGAMQDAVDTLARFIGRRCRTHTNRKFTEDVRWRHQFLDFSNANVVGIGLALQGHAIFSWLLAWFDQGLDSTPGIAMAAWLSTSVSPSACLAAMWMNSS